MGSPPMAGAVGAGAGGEAARGRAGGAAPGRVRGWLAPGVAGRLPAGSAAELLELVLRLEPAAWLRRVPGRETFPWPGRGELVVKRFRGGEPRDAWHELLARRQRRSPARREAETLAELRELGLPVPRPLAWVEEPPPRLPRRGRARSAVLLEHVPHGETLRQRLARAPHEARRWGEALSELVARLHAAGWAHRDLYLQHLVLAREAAPAAGALTLLDLGRARRVAAPGARGGTRWLVKDLAALLHSTPAAVGAPQRLRFLARWLERTGRGTGRAARRAWARRVLAKERRLAAHAPRHVDPGGARGEEPG